jgi:hypothetical protein
MKFKIDENLPVEASEKRGMEQTQLQRNIFRGNRIRILLQCVNLGDCFYVLQKPSRWKKFFAGERPKLPRDNITFKAAQHSGKKKHDQMALL